MGEIIPAIIHQSLKSVQICAMLRNTVQIVLLSKNLKSNSMQLRATPCNTVS